jgi:hypothetical protein
MISLFEMFAVKSQLYLNDDSTKVLDILTKRKEDKVLDKIKDDKEFDDFICRSLDYLCDLHNY